MGEFNHLKNFCEFLDTGADRLVKEYGDEAQYLFEEHLFNLMVEAGVSENMADRLADKFGDRAFDWIDFLFDARDIVEAYLITNDDVLDDATREKVARTLRRLSRALQSEIED